MEQTKFESRIISLIQNSLPLQRLQKTVEPIQLIRNRDRYFLVRCRISGKEHNCVFLRYEKWFFYLHGLNQIPRQPARREYDSASRISLNEKRARKEKQAKSQQKKKALEQKQLEISDRIIRKRG